MLCITSMQQYPIVGESNNNSNSTMPAVSPLRALVNRCHQVSTPQKEKQQHMVTTGPPPPPPPPPPPSSTGGGPLMRLPSKKRLMVRTWLPQPTVPTPTSSSSSSSSNNNNDTELDSQSNISTVPLKRRVHFSRQPAQSSGDGSASDGGDNNDDPNDTVVIKTVHRYPKPSERHYPNLYLSNHEKAEIQFLASSFGEAFLFEEEEAVDNLEKAFYNCDRESTTPHRSAALQRQERDLLMQESIVALQQWAGTEARGLEDVVSAEFQDVRCRTIAMILEYQAYLQQTLGTTEDSDELIRAFSEKLSARSRIFSTLMAQGDAFAARERGINIRDSRGDYDA